MTNFHAIEFDDDGTKVSAPAAAYIRSTLANSSRFLQGALSSKFSVSGIPTLVFVDQNGHTITKDGRRLVMEDPTAARFPWK